MVLLVHLMLFCICLNFGLGLAHIPNTPLTIPSSSLTQTDECRNDFTAQGLLMRVVDNSTGTPVVTYVPATNSDGSARLPDFNIQSSNMTGPWDYLIEPVEAVYEAGETIKNVALGGYVLNVVDSFTLDCDTNQYNDPPLNTQLNPNFGKAVNSEVMTYFKAGFSIMYGFILFLTVFYIITGKSFNL